jgi:hypothetical protein
MTWTSIILVAALSVTACRTLDTASREQTTVYGHTAVIDLRDDRFVAGELLLQNDSSVWVVVPLKRVVSVPLSRIRSIEVVDTKVRAYLESSLIALGAPMLVLGVVGTTYTGESGYVPGAIAVGAILVLIPTTLNELGLHDPRFTANDVVNGKLGKYLRCPFAQISTEVRKQILASYKQVEPDTLTLPVISAP